jgi:hypothetical protein
MLKILFHVEHVGIEEISVIMRFSPDYCNYSLMLRRRLRTC